METFNFAYHTPTTVFPKGDGFKFGRGWEFSAAPQLPIQRRFILHFNAVKWFQNLDGSADLISSPEYNAQLLVDFYERHWSHQKFIYPHPLYGDITVKFAPEEPLQIPKTQEGGMGVTDSFQITLVEQPL
jgi:hypothetical protein